jgi:hypothetical protein
MKEMSEYLSNIHHSMIHLGGELIDSVQPYLAVIQPLWRKFIEDLLGHPPMMGFYFFEKRGNFFIGSLFCETPPLPLDP